MKRFMLPAALTCVLSVSALAGEMPTSGAASSMSAPTVTAPGEMPTAGVKATAPGEIQSPPSLLETLIFAIITWP